LDVWARPVGGVSTFGMTRLLGDTLREDDGVTVSLVVGG